MTLHTAYCMWHVTITDENAEARWNIPKYPHIYGTIRSSSQGVRAANTQLGRKGFSSLTGRSYYPRKISLERVP